MQENEGNLVTGSKKATEKQEDNVIKTITEKSHYCSQGVDA